MKEITWDDFNYKNRNKTNSFENLCRALFLRSHKKSGDEYQYNYNQAGLEFEPFDIEKKGKAIWVGAQCKYFISENNTSQYNQIYESVETAIKLYPKKLDKIYIYANTTLQPICSEEAIIGAKRKSSRIKLAIINRDELDLMWIQKDNILDLVNQKENRDLRRMYFSDEKEESWLKHGITINEKTFLASTQFLKLRLNNRDIVNLGHEVIKHKTNLLLGMAGTGKSVLMKKIFSELSDDYFEMKSRDGEVYSLPILIKLRECISGNLETVIRERLRDYNLNNSEETCNYIYLLDGLDEVSHHDIGKIVNSMVALRERPTTKSIVISSRKNSNNLVYLYQSVDCNEYKINELNYTEIERFFSARGDATKIKKLESMRQNNAEILDDITDIFSVDLLWRIMDDIDEYVTKVEIIKKYVDHWIDTYTKIGELPLLEPKSKCIKNICEEISFKMQEKLQLNIGLMDAQDIVKMVSGTAQAADINLIMDALVELFFEISDNDSNRILAYKHRRFHEFFLFEKIDNNFIEYPELMRQLHLLPNKDFVVNIFLKTSLQNAYRENDLLKTMGLRLFEEYLGYSYLKDHCVGLVGKGSYNRSVEPFYSYSSALIRFIANNEMNEIDKILSNTQLSIGDCINKENCLELIEIHHKINKKDISDMILTKYNISKTKLVNCKNYSSYLYITQLSHL